MKLLDHTRESLVGYLTAQCAAIVPDGREAAFRAAVDSHVDDVVTALVAIATRGTQALYNVAGGVNVSNAQLFTRLGELSGCEVRALRSDCPTPPPAISIERMRAEFGWQPTALMDRLPALVQEALACRR